MSHCMYGFLIQIGMHTIWFISVDVRDCHAQTMSSFSYLNPWLGEILWTVAACTNVSSHCDVILRFGECRIMLITTRKLGMVSKKTLNCDNFFARNTIGQGKSSLLFFFSCSAQYSACCWCFYVVSYEGILVTSFSAGIQFPFPRKQECGIQRYLAFRPQKNTCKGCTKLK